MKKIKCSLEILFSTLIIIFFVVSLFARGAFLYLSSSFFIITTIAFIIIKRNSIFKPNLNKILLFSILSIILSFYIIKPSLYTEIPMVPMSSFDDIFAIDEELKKEEQSYCLPLPCAGSCHSILVLENGKKKCRVCYNSIYLRDSKYRCKSIIPITVITCLVFSYLISSLAVYFTFERKYKKEKGN